MPDDLDDLLLSAVASAIGVAVPRPAGLCDWQAKRVVRYVDEHLDQPIRVGQLAAVAKLSTSRFSRLFVQRFGITPHAYVLERRMHQAQRLIASTQQPLGEIAFQCGMADQSHLCRVFRRREGTTPAAWRRDQQRASRPDMG